MDIFSRISMQTREINNEISSKSYTHDHLIQLIYSTFYRGKVRLSNCKLHLVLETFYRSSDSVLTILGENQWVMISLGSKW